jgi:hypothetical protein
MFMQSMKNAVFWDITPSGFCKNRHFGGTYRLHQQGEKNRRTRNIVSSNYQPKHAVKKYYAFDVCGAFARRNIYTL